MGKAKKRNFNSCINQGGAMGELPSSFSRQEAIKKVMSYIKENNHGDEPQAIITLFGLKAEELSEAGATYEDLLALRVSLI